MKLLAVPVPILGAAVMQLPDGIPEGAPTWAIAAGVIVYVTVFTLNQFGLIRAGKGSDRRSNSFTDTDREMLRSVNHLLGFRGEDGIERYLLHRRDVSELREEMKALKVLPDILAELKKLNRSQGAS